MRLVRRLGLAALCGCFAVPAAAQRTGPCPQEAFAAPAGPISGVVTESRGLQPARLGSQPTECLFGPDGQVRAALYPSSPYEPSPYVRVFSGAQAGYGSPWDGRSGEKIPVFPATHFSSVDSATLERIERAAGIRRAEPLAVAQKESPSEAPPEVSTVRRAGYNPTTPSTHGSATSLRATNRTYDDFDRLKSETVQLEDGSAATISYTYWRNGQRKTVTDTVGRVTFYEYDGRNLLSRLTANQGLPDEQVTSYEYWGDGLLKTVTKPDGTVTSYDYDRADRLTSVVVQKDGAALIFYAYTYDANGNRLTQVESNGGPPETTTYTYDALDRLETVTYPDGRSVAYGYDKVGNRTAETEWDAAGVVVSEKVAAFDQANRLSTVTDAVNPANNTTFTYDRNGNLTAKTTAAGATIYEYDLRDQLVEVRQGQQIAARFAYDAFGRRYLKIGNEGFRQYLYDQTSLLQEFTEHKVEVAKYEWGGYRLESQFRLDEPRRYLHFDALGSVAALTEASGSVAARYHYDAWGRHRDPGELEASANRFGFTGYYFDTETSHYFAKARYYDPEVGRFISQDTFEGRIDEPPSLNLYLYANANPTRYVDPTGHSAEIAKIYELKRKLKEAAERVAKFGERLKKTAAEVGMGISTGAAAFLSIAPDPETGGYTIGPPGHMSEAGEREYYVQPQTETERRTAQVTDLVLTAAPLLGARSPSKAPSGVVIERGSSVASAERLALIQEAQGVAPTTEALRQAMKSLGSSADLLKVANERLAARKAEFSGVDAYGMAKDAEGAGTAVAPKSGLASPGNVEVLADAGPTGAQTGKLNAQIGELRGYQTALEEGHTGIRGPGKTDVKGVDYITLDQEGRVVVWDAKYRGPGYRHPSSLPAGKLQRWMPEIQKAVDAMPDGPAKAAAQRALETGQVVGRIFKWPPQ